MDASEERTKYEGKENNTTHTPPNKSQSAVTDHKRVLIVGAGKPYSFLNYSQITDIYLGSAGLALAHGLKKVGDRGRVSSIILTIKYTFRLGFLS